MAALHVGERSLPRYAHRFAPHTFTPPQRITCLALKAFFRTDYRGIVALLDDHPTLRRDLGLTRSPHFTTLQKAASRLLRFATARTLLEHTGRATLGRKRRLARAAVDASGFESSRISPYFVRRRSREPNVWHTTHDTRFPKLGLIGDCATPQILATYPTRGPTPDVHQLARTLRQCVSDVTLMRLYGDAGFDSPTLAEAQQWTDLITRDDLPAGPGLWLPWLLTIYPSQ